MADKAAELEVVPTIDVEQPPSDTAAAPAKETEDASPGDPPTKNRSSDRISNRTLSWPEAIGLTFGALFFFWVFLIGLTLMGSAFKVLGGAGAAELFKNIRNPISGVMIGVLATVLVQSSSTSTSIVVAMVASDILTVKQGIPIIMGANIGTTVTNTIVSMGFVGDRLDLHRAFSAATVHDMFNFLAVATFLPIEVIIGEIQGTGGPLYWWTDMLAEAALGGSTTDKLFKSPVKILTSFVANEICKSNKYVIYGRALVRPTDHKVTPQMTTCQACKEIAGVPHDSACPEEEDDGRRLSAGENYTRALLSKRQLGDDGDDGPVDCLEYSCVGSKLAGTMKKANRKAYKDLLPCDEAGVGFTCPNEKDACYIGGAKFYDDHITNGKLVSGGFLKGAGDIPAGLIGVVISLVLLSGGMLGLTKCLTKIFMARAAKIINVAMLMNDYIGILVGVGITIVVQSSSVTTSALTPLAAIGVLPLCKMFPMTLGANIGTTTTALLASLVDLKKSGVQIAMVHFFFNIIGILMWFPAPRMRAIPLLGAKTLGLYAAQYRFAPLVYVLVTFLIIPAIAFGVMESYTAGVGVGVILTLIVLAGFAAWAVWWNIGIPVGNAGCYRVMSKEDRETRDRELLEDNAKVSGMTADEYLAKTALKWTG